jgi:uncharacterized protein (UPF0332 family)
MQPLIVLYYACFYAAQALLIANSMDASTHKGVNLLPGLHFVCTNILNARFGAMYSQLFNARSIGDYGDFIYFDNDTYVQYRYSVESFISTIASIVISEQ